MIAVVAPPFIPGLQLSREFFTTAVQPLLHDRQYAAALLGPGSEVLGFDSPRSTDHDWGPRLQIFLEDNDTKGLPAEFGGVEVTNLSAWLTGALGFDPRRDIGILDWLATPTQRLAEVTTGEVFHDGPGELTRARAKLAWYPHDVWLYILACQWQRLGQEEAFPGRCAEAGDDLGSIVVTARLARDLMRLRLLMHRRYPPYSKWLGSAVARTGATELTASLTASIQADDWPTRERHLSDAYEAAARLHNQLGLTPPLDTRTRGYYDRPYQVIGAAPFTAALREAITDPRIRRLPLTGAVDQFVDSTDALGDMDFIRAALKETLARC